MRTPCFSARPASRTTAATALAGLVLVAVSACGSSDGGSTDGTTPTTPTSSTSSTSPGGSQIDPTQLQAIQECLQAAGITQGQGFPTGGAPTGIPTGIPTGGFPSGSPPTGNFGGGAGLNNAETRAALKACGLTLPSFTAPTT